MARDQKRRAARGPSSDERPLRQRAHEIARQLRTPGMSGAERVRLARAVLRSGSREAINELFRYYQQAQADSRWGLENSLLEILGPLRVQAIKALKGPPGQRGENHEAALPVLWAAGRPSDLPLLTSLLEAQVPGADGDRTNDLLMVIHGLTSEYEVSDPRLVAALERVLAQTEWLSLVHLAARALAEYRVPEAESALRRGLATPDLLRRALLTAVLVQRSPAQYLEAGEALLEEIRGRERREPVDDQEGWVRYELERSIDDAKEALKGGSDEEERSVTQALLLPQFEGAAPERRRALLRELAAVAKGGTAFFHVVWPLTSDPNEETATLAITACAATRSTQARLRLKTRLERAIAAGDVAAARPLLRGLRDHLYEHEVWIAALSLPCAIARGLALDGLEEHAYGLRRGNAAGLREAMARETDAERRRRMQVLLEGKDEP